MRQAGVVHPAMKYSSTFPCKISFPGFQASMHMYLIISAAWIRIAVRLFFCIALVIHACIPYQMTFKSIQTFLHQIFFLNAIAVIYPLYFDPMNWHVTVKSHKYSKVPSKNRAYASHGSTQCIMESICCHLYYAAKIQNITSCCRFFSSPPKYTSLVFLLNKNEHQINLYSLSRTKISFVHDCINTVFNSAPLST